MKPLWSERAQPVVTGRKSDQRETGPTSNRPLKLLDGVTKQRPSESAQCVAVSLVRSVRGRRGSCVWRSAPTARTPRQALASLEPGPRRQESVELVPLIWSLKRCLHESDGLREQAFDEGQEVPA